MDSPSLPGYDGAHDHRGVLGMIAELNLNRAYMTDDDPTVFLTRRIWLFFDR